ncbi:MAG: polysaccharide deacetylase family protein [candidate division KSB1 bacterium]|nr:polysaccharide deacetylase family protein [candidate division KSB1 bacterium]MDZ7275095.1 polysaccharide deacetylase family protein [candidate division KSB1 bacterium]MDZ7286457.1 polysaccharide deacetylase family protein [candidate division KSB1 bacterium]MDZ7299379.1 polysaccharide deacetylase family protein [candidate division KSB1 bacterium]MDZ7306292.1 polysaccharide deacetylase family protein [candidate division KSB1 bacterium]
MFPVVLAYHQVGGRKTLGVTWITAAQFERQMGWLAEAGYRTASLSACLRQEEALPHRTIVLTFDDGLRGLIKHALPVLQRHGFTATVYPVAGYIGGENRWDVNFLGRRNRHLDWGELRELLACGWEIGSHSLRHVYLPALPEAALFEELWDSRRLLEDRLQIPIRHFALPFGRGSERVFRAAQRAGYESVALLGPQARCQQWRGPQPEAAPLWLIPRRGVYLHDSLRSVQRRVQAPPDSRREYWRQRAISFFSNGTIIVKTLEQWLPPVRRQAKVPGGS